MSRRLITYLFLPLLAVGLVVSAVAIWYAVSAFNRFHENRYAKELEYRAGVVELGIRHAVSPLERAEVEKAIRRAAAEDAVRYTVVLPDGTVAADSAAGGVAGENLETQADVARALDGRVGVSRSRDASSGKAITHVAVPVIVDDRIILALRASGEIPPGVGLTVAEWVFAVSGLAAGLASLALAAWVGRRVGRRLVLLREGAQAFTRGELGRRIFLDGYTEFRGLADAMHQMASELDTKIRAALRERNELEAVLYAMVEGVVAVDGEMKIVRMNEAARRFFMIAEEDVLRMPVSEMVGDRRIVDLLTQTVQEHKTREADVTLSARWGTVLHVHCTPLKGVGERSEGAVAVINDVTRLRRLSSMRRDFVSNVSRQIRNPLHEIKERIDRLAAGEITEPREVDEVLDFVETRVNLLNSTITNLLTLSRIEQFAETGMIVPAKHRVLCLLTNVVQLCQREADAANVSLEVECAENLWGEFDLDHMAIAMAHLIDNAVSASSPESFVRVKAEKSDAALVLAVEDHGCGIEPEHAPHIFERFYRVERPGAHGTGAGLGLTIVKRIVESHSGEVTFTTIPAKGTTFFITLPLKGVIQPQSA